MNMLYIDCGMGAAGDMLTAALLELMPDAEEILEELNGLGLPGVKYVREDSVKCGLRGTQMRVLVHGGEEGDASSADAHHPADMHSREHAHKAEHTLSHEEVHGHSHADMHWIMETVSGLRLSDKVKSDIISVYRLIAEAESAVHGISVDKIHFHEVGALDAVADVAAVCLLMDRLCPEEVIASPVHVGCGSVRCAHGILPVPAPATAELLRGIPVYGGETEGELCTPTGAALLRYYVDRFGPMPVIRIGAIGYGMGKKDFTRANCVRALWGESGGGRDEVAVLACNVDDMTAEEIGFAMDRLFDNGAKEVFTVPVGMKKSRPGTMIEVICAPEDRERMAELLFRHTTTIGVRHTRMDRSILDRKTELAYTPYGDVRIKKTSGYGVTREKPEYDDIARIAREQDISLAQARELIQKKVTT